MDATYPPAAQREVESDDDMTIPFPDFEDQGDNFSYDEIDSASNDDTSSYEELELTPTDSSDASSEAELSVWGLERRKRGRKTTTRPYRSHSSIMYGNYAYALWSWMMLGIIALLLSICMEAFRGAYSHVNADAQGQSPGAAHASKEVPNLVSWKSIRDSLRIAHAEAGLDKQPRPGLVANSTTLEQELEDQLTWPNLDPAVSLRKYVNVLVASIAEGNDVWVRRSFDLLNFTRPAEYERHGSRGTPMVKQLAVLEMFLPLAVRSRSSEVVYLMRRWLELPVRNMLPDEEEEDRVCVPTMRRTWELVRLFCHADGRLHYEEPGAEDMNTECRKLLAGACVVDEELSEWPMVRCGGGWEVLSRGGMAGKC